MKANKTNKDIHDKILDFLNFQYIDEENALKEILKDRIDSLGQGFTKEQKASLLKGVIPKELEMTEEQYVTISKFIESLPNEYIYPWDKGYIKVLPNDMDDMDDVDDMDFEDLTVGLESDDLKNIKILIRYIPLLNGLYYYSIPFDKKNISEISIGLKDTMITKFKGFIGISKKPLLHNIHNIGDNIYELLGLRRYSSIRYALEEICNMPHDIDSDICNMPHDIDSDICNMPHDIDSDICNMPHDIDSDIDIGEMVVHHLYSKHSKYSICDE